MRDKEAIAQPISGEIPSQVPAPLRAGEELLPRIIVDSNERDAEYLKLLEADDLFTLCRSKLEVGDIQIEDLIIERKTTRDFHVSLQTGRLFRQLLLMKRMYRRRMLLVEGPPPGAPMLSRASYEGVLARVTAMLQIPVLLSDSGAMTARLLRRAALQLYGFTSSHSSRSIGADRAHAFHQVNILVGIPGIGLQRARALMAHFGSLQRVFGASRAELERVPGLGNYFAGELSALFSGDFSHNNPETAVQPLETGNRH